MVYTLADREIAFLRLNASVSPYDTVSDLRYKYYLQRGTDKMTLTDKVKYTHEFQGANINYKYSDTVQDGQRKYYEYSMPGLLAKKISNSDMQLATLGGY